MRTECIADLFGFEPVDRRRVEASFDGGRMTSDAGGLLLGMTARALGWVISLTNAAASLFTWELCRADGLVVQRSPKTFPTRIEALFGSAQSVAVLVLDAAGDLPLV